MRSNRSFVAQLVALVLAAMLPLLAALGYNGYEEASRARAQALRAVRSQADALAEQTASAHDRAQRLLEFLAQRPEIRQFGEPSCGALLASIVDVDAQSANAGPIARDGHVVCSTMPTTPIDFTSPPSVAGSFETDDMTLGTPRIGGLGLPALLTMRPVPDAAGATRGLVALSLDLSGKASPWHKIVLPTGAMVEIGDAFGRTVARRQAEKDLDLGVVGQPAEVAQAAFASRLPDGTGVATGPDGIERVYAVTSVPGLRWHVAVGVPTEVVEAPWRNEVLRNALGLLMALASATLLCMPIARHVARSARAAHAASQAKTRFLSRMGHELRTPLNAMLGFTQLLDGDPDRPLSPEQRERTSRVLGAGWHLLALIDDMLDVSRIEAGALHVACVPVHLGDMVAETAALSQPQARQARVELRVAHGKDGGLAACADPVRLRQVLLNLLSNAIKYNHAGGRVDVRARADGQRVMIEVADTGIGMSAEQLAHLYEPFNRLGREATAIEGIGLGLALTRQLVELMHGRIVVHSSVGEGTRVIINLPQHCTSAAPAAAPPAALQPEGASPRGQVLYIEDNPVNVLLVRQLLSRWPGVRFSHAETATEGLRQLSRSKPDVVLLDMQLPDLSGHDVLRRLRADPALHGLRVIAMSASSTPREVAEAQQAGADGYWTKPLDLARFDSDLARELASCQARDSWRASEGVDASISRTDAVPRAVFPDCLRQPISPQTEAL